MLLYFSSDKNISIFDEETKALGIDVKIETERCLTDYVRANMNKLNHLEYLAIDLEYIVDDDQEILNTLSAFKVFNSSITIIIVTFERKQGDILLARLFADGIYNFITSKNEIDMSREVKICLDHTQNSYANAIGFKLDNIEEPKEKRKGFWNNVLDNFKSKNKKEEKEFKVKETKLKKEKRPKKSKETVKDDIPVNSYKEEIYEDNYIKEEHYYNENNLKEHQIAISKEDKSLRQVIREIKSDSFGLIATFKNIEEDILVNGKSPIFMEIIEDIKVLNYFGNVVGIIEDDTAIIDINFETEILKNYCDENNLTYIFKDNIYDKLANFS